MLSKLMSVHGSIPQVLLYRPVLRAGEEVERGPGSVREGAQVRQGGPVQGQEYW